MSITHHFPGSHILLAVRDFLARYARVFTAAWKARRQLEPEHRNADELAFLPAHLELTDTPVSPTARWLLRLIIALFCVALLWASLGRLDIVAVAPGQFVVGSRTKVIQPAETGVVAAIHVRNGQAVRKGDLLIELDATLTHADHRKADDALLDARLAEARFDALIASMDSGQLVTLATADLPTARVQAAQMLAVSAQQAFLARRSALDAAIAQRQAEIDSIAGQIGPAQAAVQIATERAESVRGLLKDQFVGRQDWLTLEQARLDAERDLVAQKNRLHEARAALAAARAERTALITDMRQQLIDGQRQAREQIAQLAPDQTKAGARDRLTRLRAPVDGVVQQLAVHTIGGVVTPAQPLLAIVPTDEGIEAEVSILNKDIGFVRSGQPVVVKVESFPFTRYGSLDGVLDSVSLDAAIDEQLGPVFMARVRLTATTLNIEGVPVRMSPGMRISAEVKTGSRPVIDYLLSPLKRYKAEAMRER